MFVCRYVCTARARKDFDDGRPDRLEGAKSVSDSVRVRCPILSAYGGHSLSTPPPLRTGRRTVPPSAFDRRRRPDRKQTGHRDRRRGRTGPRIGERFSSRRRRGRGTRRADVYGRPGGRAGKRVNPGSHLNYKLPLECPSFHGFNAVPGIPGEQKKK